MKNTPAVTAPDECKVFTPAPLAQAMAGVLDDRPGDRWLEPCVGRGVFLDALARRGVDADRITAVELDRHDLSAKCGEYHPGVEFLEWSLSTDKRFDRVIGNPPFLQLHKAHEKVIEASLRIPKPGGGTVPLRANCWYAFLCASLRLLNPGGGVCLVLPSGWDYADYAADLRERMPRMFARFEVVRSAKSFFEGILDGCVVLIAEGYGESNVAERRSEFASLAPVVEYLLSPERKVNGADLPAPSTIGAVKSTNTKWVRFGEVARVRIGAVTGDAQYFLLNEARRMELGLGLSDVRPVLTRARHLEGPFVTREHWSALRDRGERVWLFWPRPRSGRRPMAVADYLEVGLAHESHLGQKTRERESWFLTEINPHADAFLSGMTSVGPWLCLNRSTELTATNTLYTVHFHQPLPLSEKAAWALSLLSSSVAAQYAKIGRCYSKGLLKFEPRDVMSLVLPVPQDLGAQALRSYEQAVDALLQGNIDTARRLADPFVCPSI